MEYFQYQQPFTLENGQSLPELTIAYHSYGELNANKDNVIWICHALTANSDVADWWPGMIGKGLLFDPEKDFIVCANIHSVYFPLIRWIISGINSCRIKCGDRAAANCFGICRNMY